MWTIQYVQCSERGSHRGLKGPRGEPDLHRDGGSEGKSGRGSCCPSTNLGPLGRRFALQVCAQLGEGVGTPKELAREESEIDSSFKITHEHSTLCRDPAPLLGYRGHGVLPQ